MEYIISQKDEIYHIMKDLPTEVLDIIYSLKRVMELDEAREWHQLCPRHIPNPSPWPPHTINDSWKLNRLFYKKKQIDICLRCLFEPGFIADLQVDSPPLCKRLQCINQNLRWMTIKTADGSLEKTISSKQLLKKLMRFRRTRSEYDRLLI